MGSRLNTLGIIQGKKSKIDKIFEELFPDFLTLQYEKPSGYIAHCWELYRNYDNLVNKSQNGKIFEYILATLLIREDILPVYLNATVAFVPNVNYDIMFYTQERGPICISLKTSLRERYKQADLEAIALKYVHRKALNYLVTLNVSEAAGIAEKIKEGEVIGLDKVVVATSNDFNTLIDELKTYQFSEPPTIKVIQSRQIITRDKLQLLNTLP